jgi:hypothetical protein
MKLFLVNKDSKSSELPGGLIRMMRPKEEFLVQPVVLQMLYLLLRTLIMLRIQEILDLPWPEDKHASNFPRTTSHNL